MAWQALADASAAMAGPAGVYFFAGAVSMSYIVARLTPTWIHRIRSAIHGEGDRASKVLVGLWEVFPTL